MSDNKWTSSQKLAIDIDGNNILVSASAGSGKTAVLVERVISKVINSHIDIDKILVVTFTSASAIELKERLLAALYKAIEKDKSNLFLKKQLELLNRATITTIHSFCLEVIRFNFFKLGIDPNVTICDADTSKLLIAKSFNNVIEKEYLNYDKSKFGLYDMLTLFNNKDTDFIDEMNRIYSYISSFEYPFSWFKSKIEKYNITEENIDLYSLDFGKEIYDSVMQDLSLISVKISKQIEELDSNDEYIKHIEMFNIDLEKIDRCLKCSNNSWDMLYENLQDINFSNQFPRVKVSDESKKLQLQKFRQSVIKDEVKKLQTNIYSKSEIAIKDLQSSYKFLEYMYKFLEEFETEYTNMKRELNYIDFSDIEHLSLKLLLEEEIFEGNIIYKSSEIAEKYKEKFVEVYTDEYQDTSFVQEAILNAVSRGNNRFMVGDIKQSIYKFRQAMPEIFNSKYNMYDLVEDSALSNLGVKILLSKNFRSRKNVLDGINYIFSKIMSNEIGDSDYLDNEKLEFGNNAYIESENINYKTEINILDLKENTEEISEEDLESYEYIKELKDFEIESRYISNRINELVNVNPFKVFNLKTNTFRNVMYKDIVILLRNIKEKGNILAEILKNNNIGAFTDSNVNLFDNDEVRLVLSFLNVIDNPYQDIDMVSLMYSIVGKFTLDEILEIKEVDKKEYIYNIMLKSTDSKVIEFLQLINKFRKYAKVYTVSEILTRMYKETNIYNQVLLFNESEESKINLDSLIDVASSIDSNASIYYFIRYIENIKDKTSGDSTTAKVIGENENVVRIMTIHKSKGLEFPVVILAGTSFKYNTKDMTNSIVLDHKLGIGINVVSEDYKISYPSIIKEGIKNSMNKSMKSEELRMLYVAMTRAKEKLIIFSSIKDYTKKMENMFLLYKGSKIDSSLIKKNTSYSDNILMSLFDIINANEPTELFDIKVHNVMNIQNINNTVNTNLENKENKVELYNKEYNSKNELEKESINLNKELIKANINYSYEYLSDVTTSKKISVSELKKSKMEENPEEIILEFKKPICLENIENKYTAARKGTLIHFILEHLDIKNINSIEDINKYIEKLVYSKIITEADKIQIDVNRIFNFICSKIGKEMKNSTQIKKEIEFVLKDNRFSQSIIQGVIDLYYLNQNNEYTLIDFKTDNINNEEEFINKYKTQLSIYKEAIYRLTNIKVSKVYIYSFKLGKEIEIND